MLNGQNTVFFLLFLGVLVTVHELGHFVAAKWAGVKVLTFSIGFGPKLVGFRRGETYYQIAWLPLGGFVRMAGEFDDDVAPEERGRTFLAAPWWKRAIITVAGPAFNLIFPIIAIFFAVVGDKEVRAARVGWAEPGSAAAVAGMRPGDLITAIDGHAVRSFDDIRGLLDGVYEREIPVSINRDGQPMVLRVTPSLLVEKTPLETIRRGLFGIIQEARAAIIGVPPGSAAEVAGLKTFDRILRVNGQLVRDEVQLGTLMAGVQGSLEVTVVRATLHDIGTAAVVVPELVTVTMERQVGDGFAALGCETGDLYVWTVFPGSPAMKAGLHAGDRLLTLDGKDLSAWVTVTQRLNEKEKAPMALSWRRAGEVISATITPEAVEVRDELQNRLPDRFDLGARPRLAFQFAPEPLAAGPVAEKMTVHFGPKDALVIAVKQVPEAIRLISIVLGKLVTAQIPSDSVGGPIMLYKVAAKSAESGYEDFLKNMALVSVNLGLVNLLPIPILDGFGLLAAIWEGIRRRPIPPKAREVANIVGFTMLLMLMVLVFYNDISKSLSGDERAPSKTAPK